MNQDRSKLFIAVSNVISSKLAKFKNSDLNRTICLEIYGQIFDGVVEILKEADLSLTNEGANYIAQQIYSGILINGKHELDPNIFDKLAKLDEINNKELLIVSAFFQGTDFNVPIVKMLKSRN